mgnify:FL=1
MNISYKKLWIELIKRDIKKSDLRKLTGLSAGTITKLNKNEPVSVTVLLSICEVLQCDIGDICSAVPEGDVTENNWNAYMGNIAAIKILKQSSV